jgi:hypothetical protein
MRSLRKRIIIGAVALFAGAIAVGCGGTYVVVPQREGGYTARDTLRGRLQQKDVRVTFHYDTTWRVDTVMRWRTIYRNGSHTDTVVAVVYDTVRVGREDPRDRRDPRDHRDPRDPRRGVDTVVVVVHDTVRVGGGRRPEPRVDTVRIVVHDTVRVTGPGGQGRPGTPGGPIVMPPPRFEPRVDTVRITLHDTVHVTVHDTVRITTRDTVRIAGRDTVRSTGRDTVRSTGRDTVRHSGPRAIHVPPGQFPPTGQCRVWIVDVPPGQQADPAACNALGTIPAGAFVLFRGTAWDLDYDWRNDPSAPAEIVALQRPARSSTPRPAPTRSLLPGSRRP